MNAREQAMDEWVRLFANRNEMAAEYAEILLDFGADGHDYRPLNAAIQRRWSYAGLRYIKQKAWRIAAERVKPAGGGGGCRP